MGAKLWWILLAAGGWAGCSDPGSGSSAGSGNVGGGGDAGALVDGDAAPASEVAGDADSDAGPAGCLGCDEPAVCIQGWCVEPEACAPGDTRECYGDKQLFTCVEDGALRGYVPVDCEPGFICREGACQPNICNPGQAYCEGLAATKVCNDEGTGFLPVEACLDGMYCTGGECTSTCLDDPKFGSYVGCAFWTVDLPQFPDSFSNPENEPHVVVVSNPNELDAVVTFEVPPPYAVNIPAEELIVPAGGSKPFQMPVINVQRSGITTTAIRLESSRPVLVHQFNPFNNANVFSNDASLLLPETQLGSDYVVMTWPSGVVLPGVGEAQNGYFTVVAVNDDTEVSVTVSAKVDASGEVPAMTRGDSHTFTLDRGQVLNIESNVDLLDAFNGLADLTGSLVSANKPIVVFGGHEQAIIGEAPADDPDASTCCAEHLEEQLLPVPTLGKDYLLVKTKPRGPEPDHYRIQAAEDNVTLATTPAIEGANGVTLAAKGDWIEVVTPLSFELSATGRVQVGQYMIGKDLTEQVTGDPSFILAVPISRLRDSYTINVPQGYDNDFVTIVKPVGSTVSTYGGPIPQDSFTAFGGGTWEYAWLDVEPGVSVFAGDQPFALSAYGYDQAVSYGYPGGMDIAK